MKRLLVWTIPALGGYLLTGGWATLFAVVGFPLSDTTALLGEVVLCVASIWCIAGDHDPRPTRY